MAKENMRSDRVIDGLRRPPGKRMGHAGAYLRRHRHGKEEIAVWESADQGEAHHSEGR